MNNSIRRSNYLFVTVSLHIHLPRKINFQGEFEIGPFSLQGRPSFELNDLYLLIQLFQDQSNLVRLGKFLNAPLSKRLAALYL